MRLIGGRFLVGALLWTGPVIYTQPAVAEAQASSSGGSCPLVVLIPGQEDSPTWHHALGACLAQWGFNVLTGPSYDGGDAESYQSALGTISQAMNQASSAECPVKVLAHSLGGRLCADSAVSAGSPPIFADIVDSPLGGMSDWTVGDLTDWHDTIDTTGHVQEQVDIFLESPNHFITYHHNYSDKNKVTGMGGTISENGKGKVAEVNAEFDPSGIKLDIEVRDFDGGMHGTSMQRFLGHNNPGDAGQSFGCGECVGGSDPTNPNWHWCPGSATPCCKRVRIGRFEITRTAEQCCDSAADDNALFDSEETLNKKGGPATGGSGADQSSCKAQCSAKYSGLAEHKCHVGCDCKPNETVVCARTVFGLHCYCAAKEQEQGQGQGTALPPNETSGETLPGAAEIMQF